MRDSKTFGTALASIDYLFSIFTVNFFLAFGVGTALFFTVSDLNPAPGLIPYISVSLKIYI